jgi:hypothetical protein
VYPSDSTQTRRSLKALDPLPVGSDPTITCSVSNKPLAEHIVEMNMLPTFFTHAAHGELMSGDTPAMAAVSARFFMNAFLQNNFLPESTPDLPGGEASRRIADRVPRILGGYENRATFVILEEDLNGVKNRVRDLVAPLSGGLGNLIRRSMR